MHEMAHEMLHRSERRTLTTKQVRETEAEAVAFVVCQSIGLQTGSASADYIQLWNGDAKLLAESLEVVQRTAAVILGAISPRPATSEEGETANQTQAKPAPIAQPHAAAEAVSGISFCKEFIERSAATHSLLLTASSTKRWSYSNNGPLTLELVQ